MTGMIVVICLQKINGLKLNYIVVQVKQVSLTKQFAISKYYWMGGIKWRERERERREEKEEEKR